MQPKKYRKLNIILKKLFLQLNHFLLFDFFVIESRKQVFQQSLVNTYSKVLLRLSNVVALRFLAGDEVFSVNTFEDVNIKKKEKREICPRKFIVFFKVLN